MAGGCAHVEPRLGEVSDRAAVEGAGGTVAVGAGGQITATVTSLGNHRSKLGSKPGLGRGLGSTKRAPKGAPGGYFRR
jgi:hypothetical protein